MIDRRSHPAARRLRDARDGRSTLFVEGVRTAEELLASPLRPLEYFFSPALKKADRLLAALRERGARGEQLSNEVMAFVSDLETPPGLIVLAERPPSRWEEAFASQPSPLVVVLDGVKNPANAGAVLRAAEGAGAAAVLQSTGGADLLAPKSLRASGGSAFRLPLGDGRTAKEWADVLSARGLSPLAADAREGALYTAVDWKRPTALFLGSETGFSEGPAPEVPKVRIPLAPPLESLNLAVAAGILLFEAARRRREGLADRPPAT